MREFLEFLDLPTLLSGLAPLVVALIVAFSLARTRFAWLAIGAGYATMIALTTGFSFLPPTVARKTLAIGLLSPFVGMAADVVPRRARELALALVVAAGALSVWVFLAVLQQREGMSALGVGGGVALFVAALVATMLGLRNDGLRGGAAGVGLGLATGIAGVLSASVGFLVAGAAIAAAAGALLVVQVVLSRGIAPGMTGAFPLGFLTALFAAGALLLAQLPWYALPLLLLIPAAVALPVPDRAPMIARAAILAAYALVAAAIPILAAWYAARGSLL